MKKQKKKRKYRKCSQCKKSFRYCTCYDPLEGSCTGGLFRD